MFFSGTVLVVFIVSFVSVTYDVLFFLIVTVEFIIENLELELNPAFGREMLRFFIFSSCS